MGDRWDLVVRVQVDIDAVAHEREIPHHVPDQLLFGPIADGTREAVILEVRIGSPLQPIFHRRALGQMRV